MIMLCVCKHHTVIRDSWIHTNFVPQEIIVTWELTLVTNIYGPRHSSILYKISLAFIEICTISTSPSSQGIHAYVLGIKWSSIHMFFHIYEQEKKRKQHKICITIIFRFTSWYYFMSWIIYRKYTIQSPCIW